ncbi:MAG: hypothetical protein ACKESA_01095 [Candidatus Hodgkinia cicadicola]
MMKWYSTIYCSIATIININLNTSSEIMKLMCALVKELLAIHCNYIVGPAKGIVICNCIII